MDISNQEPLVYWIVVPMNNQTITQVDVIVFLDSINWITNVLLDVQIPIKNGMVTIVFVNLDLVFLIKFVQYVQMMLLQMQQDLVVIVLLQIIYLILQHLDANFVNKIPVIILKILNAFVIQDLN